MPVIGASEMIDVSIIVPIYNVEQYLTRCVESILNQTHHNFELILVNDGSQDSSGEICERYRERDNRVKVIHQYNQGAGIARNSGLAESKGKYIYFCDPDDYMECTLLEDNIRLAEMYAANMVIFGFWNEQHTRKGKQVIARQCNSCFLDHATDFRNVFGDLFKMNMMFTLWNKLYRHSYLKAYNCSFENKNVGEDTLFNYHVYEHLDKVYCNENKYYHYIDQREGAATNQFKLNKFEMRYEETLKIEQLIEKWGSTNKYHQLILDDWTETLLVGINNLLFADCPYNDAVKKLQIEDMLKTDKINMLLENISIKNLNSPFSKLLIFLLKNKQTDLSLNFLKLKCFLKKRMA